MKILPYFLAFVTSLSAVGFGNYYFTTTSYNSEGGGPTHIYFENTSTGSVSEWINPLGIGGHVNDISLFYFNPFGAVPDPFEFRLTCNHDLYNTSFDTSSLVFTPPYTGYWNLEAPNVLVIGGVYDSAVPTTSQDVFSGLQAVPEPTTVALLGLGGLILRKRKK